MKKLTERGVALILTMILLLILSVMGLSLMFLAQTETWSSMNYRFVSQARDGAEAGVNAAANFLLNNYTPPGGTSDPLTAYNINARPVQTTGGSAVILSANSNVASTYPVASVQTAFNTAAQGTLAAGNTTVNYAATATLLSMEQVGVYGSPTPVTIQTWRITSDGSINGLRSADVEVSSVMERQITPTFTYAAFAESNGCGALNFGGGGSTGSYDSSAVVGGVATTSNSDGNVGTNGNLTTNGNPTDIYGNLSTPRTGVGTCSSSNVTAWTSGSGHVSGSILELPQPVTYPTPTIPPPGATNESISSATTLAPGSYGDISLTGHGVLTLEPTCPGPPAIPSVLNCTAGIYNINSISESGANTSIIIAPIPGTSPAAYLPVILNVAGVSNSTPVTLTGNSVQNPSMNPMNFQMMYAGTGTINLKGNSQACGLLYAPNATFSFAGGSNWYGAVIGASMGDLGGATIYYDRRLSNSAFTVGNWMLDSFTWKKY